MSDPSEQPFLEEIMTPILLRLEVGQVPLVLVSHPGELPPDALYQAVTDTAKAAGIDTVEGRLDGFSPYLAAAMESREERLFSIVCPSSSLDPPVHPRILNMTRSRWLDSKKALILWVPQAGMRTLSIHASNFLDFRDNYVDLENIVFPPAVVDFSRLPQSSAKLVGRQKELEALDRFWADPQVAVASLVAGGGVGKSALVRTWLENLEQQGFNSISRLFGWSFYSQGSHETQTSSGQFFNAALTFFGHRGALPKMEEAKASLLAELLQSQPSILIVDGVEPLQYPLDIQKGHFSDTGLFRLMRLLARQGLGKYGKNGLVLITSRQPIQEFDKYKDTLYRETRLDTLKEEDGAQLLQELGVIHGSEIELRKTSRQMHGHALALVLLGSALTHRHGGDIARRDQIKDLFATPTLGDHARRVMAHYDEKLWAKDGPERAFLRLLGLFDRPVEEEVFEVLRQEAQVALPLKNLDVSDFNKRLSNLEEAGLLLTTSDSSKRRWDTHPLVREYFGQKLAKENPNGYRQAHHVLFEYFKSLPEEELPDTLEKLEPLYRAVHHGCRAGEYKKALYDVYQRRILRDNQGFSLFELGAYSSDLSALAGFFPDGWKSLPVQENLPEGDRAWLLKTASFCLMSLGRMTEAERLRREGMRLFEKRKDWAEAASSAQNLCDLLLATGKMRLALETAKQGIFWAEQSADPLSMFISQACLATTLHRMGILGKSQKAFQEAENLHKAQQTNYPWLYSLRGKQYCDLLLEQAQDQPMRESILTRGKGSLRWMASQEKLLAIAMDHLTQGRALAALERDGLARQQLDRAVATIRQAGRVQYTPELLLHRSAFLRQQGEREPARQDLEEALEIAIRCGMNPYEADGRLLEGHFFLDEKKEKDAKKSLLRAEELIEQMSYGLRFAEVQLLRARWYHQTDAQREAQYWLEKARRRIEEIEQWGLKRAWKQLAVEMKVIRM